MGRWVLGAALAVALACGGGEESAEQPACVPETCAAAGATCGAVPDGCGNVLQCGTCPAGQACGGGASPNTCGPAACQPTTCAAAGATCGVLADGCGGTLACGECAAGQLCGTAGAPNTCGPSPCVKITCAAAGATCGTLSDGCGGELACGECAEGEVCGAAGKPNVCAPPPPTGAVGWAHVVSTAGYDYAIGAAHDAAGNRYLLVYTPNEVSFDDTMRLEKLAKDGTLLWSREWVVQGLRTESYYWYYYSGSVAERVHLRAADGGAVYLAIGAPCGGGGCTFRVDLGGGLATDSVLVKLRPDGEFEWQRELTGAEVDAAAVNGQGTAIVARRSRADGVTVVEKYGHDGALLASVPATTSALAIDATGDFVVAQYGMVQRYSAAGAHLWSAYLPGAGGVAAVATAADGTVVALAERVGDVSFGPSVIRAGRKVVYVFERDGRERFARGLSATYGAAVAVDPTGRAAILIDTGCRLQIEAFDLSNADLWRQTITGMAVASCYSGYPGMVSYGADHRVFVAVGFEGSAEVAGSTHVSRAVDAIGILLDP